MSGLLDHPVLSLWFANNASWDRIEKHDLIDNATDRICAFTNPEGWKKMQDARFGEGVTRQQVTGRENETPKKPEDYGPEILAKLKENKPNTGFDDVIPGGLEESDAQRAADTNIH